jgi:hypothetical protein
MKFPDFIIVGVAKCGTTPLWYNLERHPDITMGPRDASRGKTEMYFWGTSNYKKFGIDWYKKKFTGKVSGEKTPSYSGKRLAFKQMKQHIPDVKLIMCIRHPVERAYSNWKMNLKSRKAPSTFTYQLFRKRYAKMGKYINTIKGNILPIFPKEQIHFCITEWMKKDTVEQMNRIYDFLDLPRVDIERRKVKLTPITDAGENMRIRRQETWYRVWDQYQDTVQGKLRKQMLEFYRESNERLFEFLGYEIPEWKK